jgi:hypothetical protein
MAPLDTDHLLEMLRDPNVESRDVAAAAGVAREDAARAARLVVAIAKASPEDALSLPAPLAVAVARAGLAAGRTDLLAALAAHPGKEAAKEAKRGLHILKARGVAVPEPPRPAPPPPAAAPEAPLPCYATVVDGQGEQAVWIPRPVPGKGVEIAQAVISDELGLLELQLGVIGRKEWRKLVDGLLEKGRAMGIGEVDRARAVAMVAAARARNDGSGQRVPEGADLWLGQLGPAAPVDEPAAPGPLPEDREREALAASAALHFHPLFTSWMAEEGFLREIAAKLDEVAVSPLYVDDRQRGEQLARTVADAVERYFDDGRRRALSRRLLAVSAHLAAHGDADRAASAAAAGRALASGTPPGEIPFARALVYKAFPGVRAQPAAEPPGPSAPDSPLVIPPR